MSGSFLKRLMTARMLVAGTLPRNTASWMVASAFCVRQASVAAGRRSGNSPRLPVPNGHDVEHAVGAWLGAHAFVWPRKLVRISGNRPHRLQDGGVRRDRHHRQCCCGACSSSAMCTASPPGASSLACGQSSGNLFTDLLPSSESLLPSGSKCHTCCDTPETPRMRGPRDGR